MSKTSHCFEVFLVVFPVGLAHFEPRAHRHSRTRNGNTVIKDANLKIQAYTLTSVFDGDSNKTITKAICLKGPKLFSAKGMASLYFCSDNRVIL